MNVWTIQILPTSVKTMRRAAIVAHPSPAVNVASPFPVVGTALQFPPMNRAAEQIPCPHAVMKRRAKHQFDAWADDYDHSILNHFHFRPSYITLMEEIARFNAERQRPFRILDVGCGTGTLTTALAASPWQVDIVGLDYAGNMCSAAAAKFDADPPGERPHFVNGDSEHLPFDDASFDIITCSNSFHHYPHQQTVVTEMTRLLTPGGRLIIIDGFRDCAIGWFVFDVAIARVEGDIHHAAWPVMSSYFETAGLTAIRRRKFNVLFPAFATVGDKVPT